MPKINKYIDPMVDYGFKVIFKESGKKQLLIRPLNAVFGLDIIDIDITESEQLGLTAEERKARRTPGLLPRPAQLRHPASGAGAG